MLSVTESEAISEVWQACAYGDMDKLREFIAADPESSTRPDAQGFGPLQWAALNNRVDVATFLLQSGAQVDATDNTGQSALHWSAVRGALPCMEALLRHGADPALRDAKGYSVCHVAAQYGQTAVLYHLALIWNCDVDCPDHDGRTPLHWAAYKGHADTVRLLVAMEARLSLADREGCSPLHWAAIRGNGEAATVLLMAGGPDLLDAKDVTGSTPALLAIEKQHRHLGVHLADYRLRDSGGACGRKGRLAWAGRLGLSPVVWALIFAFTALYVFKVASAEVMGPMSFAHTAWTWVGLTALGGAMVCLYLTTTTDPGYISTSFNGSQSHRTPTDSKYRYLDSPALWAGHWSQLCVTCKIVRPLRAKHDRTSNRCIEVFDHYCPWVGNAIGKGNRHWFVGFLWLMLLPMAISAVIAIMRIQTLTSRPGLPLGSSLAAAFTGHHRASGHNRGHQHLATGMVWVFLFVTIDLFLLVSVCALGVSQAAQIARNVTTNEVANWTRYHYLVGRDGSYKNQFDAGIVRNCLDTCMPSSVGTAPVVLSNPSSRGVDDRLEQWARNGGDL